MSTSELSHQTSFVFQPKGMNSRRRDTEIPAQRTPRVTRMMALAIHLRSLVDNGQVRDYTSLAELGHVSRARITQIMDLTLLAPDVQEALLFLPKIEKGRDRINERMLREIAAEPMWDRQRERWKGLW